MTEYAFYRISKALNKNFITDVVISGHMLGLDLEREEYRVRAVSPCYGDPSFNYVYSFVCVYYSILKS